MAKDCWEVICEIEKRFERRTGLDKLQYGDRPLNWPPGTGPAEYDYWTPLLVDYHAEIKTVDGEVLREGPPEAR